MAVVIDPFRPEHAGAFGELNRAWLTEHDLMEPSEEGQLADPRAHFIDGGGEIFVALDGDTVIGTAAVTPHGEGTFELAKLTVAPAYRGQGIARRLVERCLAWARERRARRVILVSNSRLGAALRLYESLGFEYRPVPEGTQYVVADVCMVLTLDATGAGP